VSNNQPLKPSNAAMGRGLETLIPKSFLNSGKTILTVLTSDIIPSPLQPRHHFDPDELAALATTIEAHGIIQPLVVRRNGNQFELIAGERRWRAAKLAGLERVPIIIRDSPDDAVLKVALIENMHREDLNPLDIAAGYKQLIDQFAMTHQELADLFSKNRSTITNTLRLLSLSPAAQDAVYNKQLSEGHARVLAGHPEQEADLLNAIITQKLSVREAEKLATRGATPTPKPPVSQTLRTLANRLSKQLNLPLSISGTEAKGRITLRYTSAAQRQQIESLLSNHGPDRNVH